MSAQGDNVRGVGSRLMREWLHVIASCSHIAQRASELIVLAVVGVTVFGYSGGVALAAEVPAAGGLTVHTFAEAGGFSAGESPNCEATAGENGGSIEQCFGYQVTVTNSGGLASEGPIVVKEELPAGFSVTRSVLLLEPTVHTGGAAFGKVQGECEHEGEPVVVTCTFSEALAPDEALVLRLFVTGPAGTPSGLVSVASANGPASPEASATEPLVMDAPPLSFGPSNLVSYIASANGAPDTQAGDHPYEMTTRIDLKNGVRRTPEGHVTLDSVQDVKDVVTDLPMGFLGDAQAAQECTFPQLETQCPSNTVVGQIRSEPEDTTAVRGELYNMVPEHGVAAEFGFHDVLGTTHVIYATVAPTPASSPTLASSPPPAGYVLRATAREVPQVALTSVTANFFGDPVARDGAGSTQVAMFTNPSDCSSEPLVSTVHMDSWQEPGQFSSNGDPGGEPEVDGPKWMLVANEWPAGGTVTPAASSAVTGCNQLHFKPSAFSLQPDTASADSPTGLTIDEQVPQTERPGTLATPPLRDEILKLPPGLVPNPAAASGLTGCSEAQIGWLGGSTSNFTAGAPTCPDASKIGSVEVTTPLLDHALPGTLYLAKQNENPFGSILAGYIVIDDPISGIIVKVPGKIELDEKTGQITGNFSEAPQLSVFSDLKLRFFGGERGELATPESCGTYETTGQLTPWSAPESGPPANVESSFAIDARCVPEFAPSFSAATSSPQAGGYSPLTLAFSRQDNEQEISNLTVTLPPGLTARLAGVAKCSDAALQAAKERPSGASEIASPSCPAASEVGTVQASAGAGSQPFTLGGKAYLTGPYNNAPLGLAVIIPAVAGPFDLGNVVVRTALHVDPNDAHVTAVSDPLPTIVDAKGLDNVTDGFPVRMRSVTVSLNRNTYTLNPTNCNPMAIGAAFTSTGGLTSIGSSRFQAGGCRELAFKPGFAAGTQGHASKAKGTSLKVHITSSFGQANIAKVKVTLPKQLPSRLTTLQKACLDSVFEANPAACPQGSVVGTAVAHTPLLEQPFTGPAYLVSHGGAAFPDLEYVLESEHIKLILDGKTDIKKGITTSSFNTVPDAPVTSFETNFPAGPHSILGTFLPVKANYNLCGQKLSMPTVITGQNGAVVKQTTKITISGCPKAKKKHKAKKHNAKHAAKKH
jgi:hypothetical protein